MSVSTVLAPKQAETQLAVGIGQCIVARDPAVALVAYGLGSCVALAAWDAGARVAGVIHILLPEPAAGAVHGNPARFATTGVPYFLQTLAEAGAQPARLRLVAAGGAQMLSMLAHGPLTGIGVRNLAVIKECLQAAGIPLVAADCGGQVGRTLTLSVATGHVHVRASTGATQQL